MMVDADLAGAAGGLVTGRMTRAFVTGVTGQDGTYLAERLLAEGVEVHGLAHGRRRRCPTSPGRRSAARGRPGRRRRRPRAGARPRARRDLQPRRAQLGRAVLGASPTSPARVNGAAAVGADGVRAGSSRSSDGRPVRFVQASSAEIFGEPDRRPQDEATPIRPVNPYGAAKAYAHLMVDVYRQRGLHAVSVDPLQPRVAAPAGALRDPQDHLGRRRDRPRARPDSLALGNLDARRDWGWAPDYVDAMVRAARADAAGDYVVATGVEPLGARLRRRRLRAAPASPTGSRWSSVDPAFVRPADATELVGDAEPGARRSSAGRRRSPSTEIVGRMVDADLARSSRSTSSGSSRAARAGRRRTRS